MTITMSPIGIIHTPHKEPKGTPIQPGGANGAEGIIELKLTFEGGLEDIEGFSHLILLYHFHRLHRIDMRVKPFMDDREHGVFATRSPARPNHIGMSVVRLTGVEKNMLFVEGVDMLDGTPVLDIKPYVPQFDSVMADRIGWLDKNVDKHKTQKDDGRFL